MREKAQKLLNDTALEFAKIPHPAPDEIKRKGCCADCDAWISWCSSHTSEDFLQALREGGFDQYEFGTLLPQAYHYFSAAVVRFCLEQIALGTGIDPYPPWVDTLVPLKDSAADFHQKYVCLFSSGQRSVIKQLLELSAQAYFEQEEMIESNLTWAASEIWKTA